MGILTAEYTPASAISSTNARTRKRFSSEKSIRAESMAYSSSFSSDNSSSLFRKKAP